MSSLNIYLKDNKLKSILLIILSLFIAYLSLVVSNNLKYVFNSDRNEFNNKIITIIVSYIFIYFLELIINWFRNSTLYGGQRNLHRICLDKVLKTNYSYILENDAAAISSDIGTVSNNVAMFFNALVLSICTLISLITYMIIIFKISSIAGAISIMILPLFYVVTIGMKKKINHYQERYRKYNNQMFSLGIEVLNSAKNVKSKNIEDFFVNKVDELNRNVTKNMTKYSFFENYCEYIIMFLSSFASFFIIYVSNKFNYIVNLSNADLIILFLFTPLFFSSFKGLYNVVLQFYKAKPYLKQFKHYFNLKEEDNGTAVVKEFNNIETKSLKVTLKNNQVLVIPDMDIKRGDKVLIKGESGIGKSTLFDIILGLRKDYCGSVNVNGTNMKNININEWRKHIGMSFQNSSIYYMSIEDNIKLGNETEIKDIIRMVELEKQVKDKEEDRISSNNISGGEKSRISMAQAIINNPDIILIDESTSSLDEAMEGRILNRLVEEFKDKTILCISHRQSADKFFNKVINFYQEELR